jgi:hypothetical protein
LARQIIEVDFATGGADGVFLAGGHQQHDNVSRAIGREPPWQTICFNWNAQ